MDHDLENGQRLALLQAVLPHVVFDGWSERAIKAGARDIGLGAGAARALFPDGVVELIELHSQNTDRRLAAWLATSDLSALRVRERIITGVRHRLEMAASDREAVRRAVTVLSLPGNTLRGMRLLYATVDTIWRAAGDTATDWNFYSKRGLLAAVYSATVLYWLQDESPEYEDTWGFLDRRIDDVMKVPKATARIGNLFRPMRRPKRTPAPRL